MDEKLKINWFPGHMRKAERKMREDVSMVDLILELVDARAPLASRSTLLSELIGDKPLFIIINRADQVEKEQSDAYKRYFETICERAFVCDSVSGKGINGLRKALESYKSPKMLSMEQRGVNKRKLRAMVIGIPNVGKSTLINRLIGKKLAAAEDRPGVTRGRQWLLLSDSVELLDTPGILQPKLEGEDGVLLALTGAIKENIYDDYTLSIELLKILKESYRKRLEKRYKLNISSDISPCELLALMARKRGYILRGGELDLERISKNLIDEFQSGKLGKICLQKAGEDLGQ